MSRKDYIRSARIIAHIADEKIRHYVATEFADMFQWDNPRFNRDRFLRACGLEEQHAGLMLVVEEM